MATFSEMGRKNISRNREEFFVERGAKVEPGVFLKVFDAPNLTCRLRPHRTHTLVFCETPHSHFSMWAT